MGFRVNKTKRLSRACLLGHYKTLSMHPTYFVPLKALLDKLSKLVIFKLEVLSNDQS